MSEDASSDSQGLVPSEGPNVVAPVSRLIRRGLDDLCVDEDRMLRFPPDRSVGQIQITKGKWRGFVIGEARGDISVRAMLKKACQVSDDELPPDQDLKWRLLVPEELSPVDLSPLQNLRADVIQDLVVQHEPGRITCHGAQLAYLQHMTGLKKLEIYGSLIGDDHLDWIRGLVGLRVLALPVSQMTDKGLEYLLSLPSLENLNLTACRITDQGLHLIGKLTALRELYLGGNNITGSGLCHLRTLTGLTALGLENTLVDDENLKYLEDLPSLRQLNLNGTRITDRGLHHLERLHVLERLSIGNTRVTEYGQARLSHVPPRRIMASFPYWPSGSRPQNRTFNEVVKLTLDTNLFYDVAESRAGAADVESLLELSRQGKVMLYSTATTDFEDQSGAATRIVLNLIKEGKLQEAPNAGTHREFMPGGPGLHHIEEQECESLLQDIWPKEQWKSASDNKRSDVFHLLASQRNKHDYFVTNDRELLRRRVILKLKHAIAVLSPHESLECYDLPAPR